MEELTICWKCNGARFKFSKKRKAFCAEAGNCGVCMGTGKLRPSKKSRLQTNSKGVVKLPRGPPDGGKYKGPPAHGSAHKLPAGQNLVKPGETVMPLGCGDWLVREIDRLRRRYPVLILSFTCVQIFQLTSGHKLTVDDFFCAWVAVVQTRSILNPKKQQLQYVDLGCGCGSVLMHLAWAFPQREVRHPCPHLE